VPYREPPRRTLPERRGIDNVDRWIDLAERFGHLEVSDVWKSPPSDAFERSWIDGVAVSGDGRRALIAGDPGVFLLELATMSARRLEGDLDHISAVSLDHRGAAAIIVAGERLLRWALDEPAEPEVIARSRGLTGADAVALDRDLSIAAITNLESSATIRIYDLRAGSLVYSFDADCRHGLHLHPSGRALVCMSNKGFAEVHRSDGVCARFGDAGGGAMSPDGAQLALNDVSDRSSLRLFTLDERGGCEPRGTRALDFELALADSWMSFSPAGDRLLVRDRGHRAQRVDLGSGDVCGLDMEMTRATRLLADGRALSGPSWDGASRSVELAGSAGDRLGQVVLAIRDSKPAVIGETPGGLFGALGEEPDRFPGTPFERPRLVAAMLGGAVDGDIDRRDQLLADEATERQGAWKSFRSRLTADINTRDLAAWSAGLIALIPELVERACSLAEAAARPAFGPPRATAGDLEAAAAELRALVPAARGERFDAMIRRLASDPVPEPDPEPAPELASVFALLSGPPAPIGPRPRAAADPDPVVPEARAARPSALTILALMLAAAGATAYAVFRYL
jgi:hypothetical protein